MTQMLTNISVTKQYCYGQVSLLPNALKPQSVNQLIPKKQNAQLEVLETLKETALDRRDDENITAFSLGSDWRDWVMTMHDSSKVWE